MNVEVRYGEGVLAFEIPEENLSAVIRPWRDEENKNNAAVLSDCLSSEAAEEFRAAIRGKRVCVLVDDGTRDMAFDGILPEVFELLGQSESVQFLICTGTHNADTPENAAIIRQISKYGNKSAVNAVEIHTHTCREDEYLSAGQTSHGTDILFNAKLSDADVFLAISDVKVHYFAGYSNPVKNFVPGICAFPTVEQNHSLALEHESTFGLHPWHNQPSRRNNPLAADQVEGMRMITGDRPVYALVTVTTSRQIQWAGFGHIEKVSSEAFATVDERNTRTIEPVDRMIVSPGGWPNDMSLYIAQRALELTKNGVADGGEVLFLAACAKGIGEEQTIANFYNRLTVPIDEVLNSIESDYKLFSHKAYKFAAMIKRLRRIWMYSQIPDDFVEAAHLSPVHDPQAVVYNWLSEQPDTKIAIIDGANKIALYAKHEIA